MERSLPPYNSQGLRTLSLLRRTFSHSIDTSTKKVLYLALVRLQLLYCSPIWHSNLICDITALERIQRLATKYILNDHPITKLVFSTSICYYTYDLCDILFFIKSVQHPTNHFNINNYVSFCHHPTRSSTSNKLQHNFTSSNKLYFNRLPRTYCLLGQLQFLGFQFQFSRVG